MMAKPTSYSDRLLRERMDNQRNPKPLKGATELLKDRIENERRRNSGQGLESLRPTSLPSTSQPKPSSKPKWNGAGMIKGMVNEGRRRIRNFQGSQEEPVDNSQYGKSLEDFLKFAQQLTAQQAQSQLGILGGQEDALKRNASDIQGKIKGGYSALSSFIDGRAPVLEENYKTGIEGVSDAATRAQSAISEGTAKAQAQQQAIMSRLGIEDANIPIANTSATLEEEMANRISDSAQRAQGAETQLNSNMSTELGYNTAMGRSAALEGQGQQDRVSRDLLSRLAELASQRQMIQTSSQNDALGLAQGLMGQDYDIWQGNYNRRYQTEQDAMNNAMKMAEAQGRGQESPELNATTWSALGPAGQAQYSLQQSGVQPQQAAEIMGVITEQMASGKQYTNAYQFIEEIQRLARERGLDPISTQNAAQIYFNYMG